jgi:hypothetical protein
VLRGNTESKNEEIIEGENYTMRSIIFAFFSI